VKDSVPFSSRHEMLAFRFKRRIALSTTSIVATVEYPHRCARAVRAEPFPTKVLEISFRLKNGSPKSSMCLNDKLAEVSIIL